MEESTEDKLKRARSLRDDYELETQYVGIVLCGYRAYRVYEDSEGNTWYRTFFVEPSTGEIISEEEHIFGKTLKKRLPVLKKW